MYDRYIFYQASANKKELVVWSSFYAHEDYMKRNKPKLGVRISPEVAEKLEKYKINKLIRLGE